MLISQASWSWALTEDLCYLNGTGSTRKGGLFPISWYTTNPRSNPAPTIVRGMDDPAPPHPPAVVCGLQILDSSSSCSLCFWAVKTLHTPGQRFEREDKAPAKYYREISTPSWSAENCCGSPYLFTQWKHIVLVVVVVGGMRGDRSIERGGQQPAHIWSHSDGGGGSPLPPNSKMYDVIRRTVHLSRM